MEEEWREWAEARSWHQYEAMRKQQDKAYEQRCAAEKEHCKKVGSLIVAYYTSCDKHLILKFHQVLLCIFTILNGGVTANLR